MPTDAVIANLTSAAFVVSGIRATPAVYGSGIGALGINMGGPVDWRGDGARMLQYGARQDTVEGTPTAPCLALDFWGFWRFRWLVATGNRSVTVYAKQVSNVAVRPSVVLKANAAVGLAADVEVNAGSSNTWIAITASFVCSSPGMVWVELHNNCLGFADPCFFDRISVV